MSTVLETSGFLRRETMSQGFEDNFAPYSSGERLDESVGQVVRYARITREEPSRETKHKPKVLRRLEGFLVELQANEARVAFVEKGQTILYDLPASQLRHAGIEIRNQPFQMDEIEMEAEDGGWIVGYRFISLAKPSDAYIESLNFDEERKRKRDLILKEFGKTQS